MARVNAAQFAEKWARRLSGSTQDIIQGVERVSESPTDKAANAQDKMRARLLEAIDSGKWAAGLRRVTLADWKQAMTTRGIQRLAAGVDAAKPKVQAFAEQLLAHIDRVKGQVDSMPDVTFEDSMNRMLAFSRGMHEFTRS